MAAGKIAKKGKKPGTVDNWLDTLGLYRKNVAYDETCFFRAISEQLYDCQVYHERVRRECVEYARNNFHVFTHIENDESEWNEHLDMLAQHMVVCGTVEIYITSMRYNRDVMVFDAMQQEVVDVTKRELPNKLLLCLMDEDHYDVVYKKEYIETAGFCQSIVYKLLYEEVFQIPNVDDIVDNMLYGKNTLPSSPDVCKIKKENNNNDDSSEENDYFENNPSGTNIAPFPFKVAKALDPSIYRNIEYDSWGEVRRELRLGEWYYGDDKLILGTRCVLNDPRRNQKYDCYIQEIIKDRNKCVVYLTKLAEKWTVDYADLSPENDAKPWPLPYRFSKNLVLGPSPPLQLDKATKQTVKKRSKDKRRTKSCSESSAIGNAESHENVTPYIGVPLQMQNPSDTVPFRPQIEPKIETPEVTPTPDASVEVQNSTRYQWGEVPQWPYLTPTPDWPQTPTTSQNVFNFAVKPMVLSAPVTPDVMSYYDPNYQYYYNYPIEPNNQWVTPTPDFNNLNQSDKTDDQKFCKVSYPYVQHEFHPETQPERPTVCTSLQPPVTYHEVYSPMIPIPPGTPVMYTGSDLPEMMMPTPLAVYTPPVDVQYLQPSPYVVPLTPPTPWYPSSINSHGFIFPTVMSPSDVQK